MKRFSAFLAMGVVMTLASNASALVFVGTRAGINANDSIGWRANYGASFNNVANPSLGLTALSTVFQVSGQGANTGLQRLDEGNGWNGIFNGGDDLLFMNQGTVGNALSIRFAVTQYAVGMRVQENFFGVYDATIAAYDGLGLFLGAFTVQGNNTGGSTGTAPFLGVESNQPNIGRIDIYSNLVNGGTAGTSVDMVSLRNCAVPEPGTIAALGLGAIALIRRRRSA